MGVVSTICVDEEQPTKGLASRPLATHGGGVRLSCGSANCRGDRRRVLSLSTMPAHHEGPQDVGPAVVWEHFSTPRPSSNAPSVVCCVLGFAVGVSQALSWTLLECSALSWEIRSSMRADTENYTSLSLGSIVIVGVLSSTNTHPTSMSSRRANASKNTWRT